MVLKAVVEMMEEESGMAIAGEGMMRTNQTTVTCNNLEALCILVSRAIFFVWDDR